MSSAIIDRSGNNNMPFTFLLGLGFVSLLILLCVDVDKSRHECRRYLEEEAVRIYKLSERELVTRPAVPEEVVVSEKA